MFGAPGIIASGTQEILRHIELKTQLFVCRDIKNMHLSRGILEARVNSRAYLSNMSD